jgi:hypothetical protein
MAHSSTSYAPGESGGRGQVPIVLTAEQLEAVTKLTTGGARTNASFARGLRISVSTWKTLRHERQPDEIAEAIAVGESRLHDTLFSNELRIALNSDDDRERRAATEYLLSSRFGYNPRAAAAVSIDINSGDQNGQLTLVQEVVEPSRLQALAAALHDKFADDPMEHPPSPTGPRLGPHTPPLNPSHPLVHQRQEAEIALPHAWDGGLPETTSTVVHVRRDDLERG